MTKEIKNQVNGLLLSHALSQLDSQSQDRILSELPLAQIDFLAKVVPWAGESAQRLPFLRGLSDGLKVPNRIEDILTFMREADPHPELQRHIYWQILARSSPRQLSNKSPDLSQARLIGEKVGNMARLWHEATVDASTLSLRSCGAKLVEADKLQSELGLEPGIGVFATISVAYYAAAKQALQQGMSLERVYHYISRAAAKDELCFSPVNSLGKEVLRAFQEFCRAITLDELQGERRIWAANADYSASLRLQEPENPDMKRFRDACDNVASHPIRYDDIPTDLRSIALVLRAQRHANYPPRYRGPLLDGEEELEQLASARLAAMCSPGNSV